MREVVLLGDVLAGTTHVSMGSLGAFQEAPPPPHGEEYPPRPPEPEPPPPEPKPPVVGWPPPAVPLKAAWVKDPMAPGGWVYVLQYGDTLSGLAMTYLGAYTRWREIWAMQQAMRAQGRSPDKLFAGEKLYMPEEAIANARKRKLVPMKTAKKVGIGVALAAATVVTVGGVGAAIIKWG